MGFMFGEILRSLILGFFCIFDLDKQVFTRWQTIMVVQD